MTCFLNVSVYYHRLGFILWCLLEVGQSNLSQNPHWRNSIFKTLPIFHRYVPELHFSNLLLQVNAPCLCLYFKSRHGRAVSSGNILQINASIRYSRRKQSFWSLFYYYFFSFCYNMHIWMVTLVYTVLVLQRGLALGQKKHWSMKPNTNPPWSNVTIMIVLLGTKLPSGCTIHSSPMHSPHATSSFHLLGRCPFLLTRKQQSRFWSKICFTAFPHLCLLLNLRALIII